MKIKSSALLLALLCSISAAAQTTPHFEGQTWWSHIKVLADDKLEGRDTGSRGHGFPARRRDDGGLRRDVEGTDHR